MAVIYLPKDPRYANIGRDIQQGLLQGFQLGMKSKQIKQRRATSALATFMEFGGDLSLEQASGIEKDLGWKPGFLSSFMDKVQEAKTTKGFGQPGQPGQPGTSAMPTMPAAMPATATTPVGTIHMPSRPEREAEAMRTTARIKEEMGKEFFPEHLRQARLTAEAEAKIKSGLTKEEYGLKENLARINAELRALFPTAGELAKSEYYNVLKQQEIAIKGNKLALDRWDSMQNRAATLGVVTKTSKGGLVPTPVVKDSEQYNQIKNFYERSGFDTIDLPSDKGAWLGLGKDRVVVAPIMKGKESGVTTGKKSKAAAEKKGEVSMESFDPKTKTLIMSDNSKRKVKTKEVNGELQIFFNGKWYRIEK